MCQILHKQWKTVSNLPGELVLGLSSESWVEVVWSPGLCSSIRMSFSWFVSGFKRKDYGDGRAWYRCVIIIIMYVVTIIMLRTIRSVFLEDSWSWASIQLKARKSNQLSAESWVWRGEVQGENRRHITTCKVPEAQVPPPPGAQTCGVLSPGPGWLSPFQAAWLEVLPPSRVFAHHLSTHMPLFQGSLLSAYSILSNMA